jgi:hypothetical protein
VATPNKINPQPAPAAQNPQNKMNPKSDKSLEQRVALLEKRVPLAADIDKIFADLKSLSLPQSEDLSRLVEGQKRLIANHEAIKRAYAEQAPLLAFVADGIGPLGEALFTLGESLLILDTRQQNMARFLSKLDASESAKEIFSDQLAREESATEKIQLFMSLVKLARVALKRKNPPGS